MADYENALDQDDDVSLESIQDSPEDIVSAEAADYEKDDLRSGGDELADE